MTTTAVHPIAPVKCVSNSPIETSNVYKSFNATTSSAESRKNQLIGPWKLGRTLGLGSTGKVVLAKHTETGQKAAVKIILKTHIGSGTNVNHDIEPGLSYGIEREIIIMKLIDHPNVMRLYDVWESTDELFLVLEYIEGGELFDYLVSRGPLDEKEAIGYFRQLMLGAHYCHSFNIW